MKVAIFGLGYVRFTAAYCTASDGHQDIGIDVSEKKVRSSCEVVAPNRQELDPSFELPNRFTIKIDRNQQRIGGERHQT